MLVKWEQGDPEVRALWEKMNNWVYAGFDETYKKMGVSFDKIYYESQTYLKGKAKVEEGLAKDSSSATTTALSGPTLPTRDSTRNCCSAPMEPASI